MADHGQDRALALLRTMRHSHLNHLQVVLGWLQLDRADRARAHLEAVARTMTAESGTLQRLPGSLALAVLELGLEAEAAGVALEWQVEGSPQPPAEASIASDLAEARTWLNQVAAVPGGERRLVGVIRSDGSFRLQPGPRT